MPTLAFDRVFVEANGKRERELSAQDFLDLPLHERVNLLVSKRLVFSQDGKPVDQLTALKSLRG